MGQGGKGTKEMESERAMYETGQGKNAICKNEGHKAKRRPYCDKKSVKGSTRAQGMDWMGG